MRTNWNVPLLNIFYLASNNHFRNEIISSFSNRNVGFHEFSSLRGMFSGTGTTLWSNRLTRIVTGKLYHCENSRIISIFLRYFNEFAWNSLCRGTLCSTRDFLLQLRICFDLPFAFISTDQHDLKNSTELSLSRSRDWRIKFNVLDTCVGRR